MKTFISLLLILVSTLVIQAAAFPVKYSPDKKYLVDSNNIPFPILGRTSWFIDSLSVSNYKVYIDDTVSKGYTAIEFHVLNHDPRGNNEPFAGNGALPFLKRVDGTAWTGNLILDNSTPSAADFSTPNTNFWNHIDGLLSYCESNNILVCMFPAYVGYNGGQQGWMKEMVANGTNRMFTYGSFIANRYKNQKNIIWMLAGDKGAGGGHGSIAFSSTEAAVEIAMINGIKSVSGLVCTNFSAELDSQTISTDDSFIGSYMTVNGAYSWTGDVVTQGRRAYSRTPVMPSFLLEEPYDEEGPDGNNVNPSAIQPVRRFQWWGWLSTIEGYIAGNGYVWPFNSTWSAHLNTQGAQDMKRLNAFVKSIAWYSLVPSGLNGMKTIVTAGAGSNGINNDGTPNSGTTVVSAANTNKTLMVAYIPPDHTGTITVDMTVMGGTTKARWYDPTSTNYTTISTNYSNIGTVVFTPPSANSVGQHDWVLIMERVINPPTVSLSISNQTTTVTANGSLGIYKFDGTTNLVNWSEIGTKTNTTGTVTFTEPFTFQSRYYRVRVL